jgi:hypothetical protein
VVFAAREQPPNDSNRRGRWSLLGLCGLLARPFQRVIKGLGGLPPTEAPGAFTSTTARERARRKKRKRKMKTKRNKAGF